MDTMLFTLFLGTPLWLWFTFIGLVVGLLILDLGVLNKGDHEIGVRESLRLSALYITLGVAFGGFVWSQFGGVAAAEYMTAFVVEKTGFPRCALHAAAMEFTHPDSGERVRVEAELPPDLCQLWNELGAKPSH